MIIVSENRFSGKTYFYTIAYRFLGALDAGQKNRVEGFLELADNLLSASQGEAQSLCMLQLVGVTGYENYGARIGWLKAGIFSLKHESSTFRSFIQPCMLVKKCHASSPWDKQHRA